MPESPPPRSGTSPCPKCGTRVEGMRLTACFCGWRSDPDPPLRPPLRLVPPPENDQ